MQQSDPAKYQQVMSQIAANLQTAAQTATANGNTTQAAQLTQLATDFSNASQNNTLGNIQDLAQAIGGAHRHGHHHFHIHNAASTSSSQSSSLNPLAIINNTLSTTGS